MIHSMAKHNFDNHLISLSNSKDILEAKGEWVSILKETREFPDRICICQHSIKHTVYMYNYINGNAITVGSGCHKKFNMSKEKMKNDIFKEKLVEFLSKGEYVTINNLIEYSNEIKQQIVDYFGDKIETLNNIDELTRLKIEIKGLIDKYNLDYLQEVLGCVELKIKELERKHAEYQMKEIERIKKIKEEQQRLKEEQRRIHEERLRGIQLENEARERAEQERCEKIKEQNAIAKQKEKEEKENIERERIKALSPHLTKCSCGLAVVCRCEHPLYKLNKASNNLYCTKCKHWKCRLTPLLKYFMSPTIATP